MLLCCSVRLLPKSPLQPDVSLCTEHSEIISVPTLRSFVFVSAVSVTVISAVLLHTVTHPMAKAQTSVREVTVMATPAWRMAFPILSPRSSVVRDFSALPKHCRITNMSSIPMPGKKLILLTFF